MDDNERKLLEDHHLLFLPRQIDHDAFKLVVEACMIHPQPFKMHCQGDGGDSTAAMGIVDVVRAHGSVMGLLTGEANSCSGIIFAGCPIRYTYPHGSIGLHACGMGTIDHVDAAYAREWARELARIDHQQSKIFAEASGAKWNKAYWFKRVNSQGGHGFTRLESAFLIECGMAKPIAEMPASSSTNTVQPNPDQITED